MSNWIHLHIILTLYFMKISICEGKIILAVIDQYLLYQDLLYI